MKTQPLSLPGTISGITIGLFSTCSAGILTSLPLLGTLAFGCGAALGAYNVVSLSYRQDDPDIIIAIQLLFAAVICGGYLATILCGFPITFTASIISGAAGILSPIVSGGIGIAIGSIQHSLKNTG